MGRFESGDILLADDIALMALTRCASQEPTTKCEEFSQKWRFSYNHSKSKVLVLTFIGGLRFRDMICLAVSNCTSLCCSSTRFLWGRIVEHSH